METVLFNEAPSPRPDMPVNSAQLIDGTCIIGDYTVIAEYVIQPQITRNNPHEKPVKPC